jgi:crossover junction endodeoxyribonuclease RuvC
MITVGIDPGYTGALAALVTDRLLLVDMPLIKGSGKVKDEIDEKAIYDWLAMLISLHRDHVPHVFIEKVSSMPGQGVTSTFRFGVSYGIVRATAAGLALPVTLITPQRWQSLVGLPKSLDKVSRKALSRQRAANLFPGYASHFSRVKDSGRADATLIAVAGQKVLAGN